MRAEKNCWLALVQRHAETKSFAPTNWHLSCNICSRGQGITSMSWHGHYCLAPNLHTQVFMLPRRVEDWGWLTAKSYAMWHSCLTAKELSPFDLTRNGLSPLTASSALSMTLFPCSGRVTWAVSVDGIHLQQFTPASLVDIDKSSFSSESEDDNTNAAVGLSRLQRERWATK